MYYRYKIKLLKISIAIKKQDISKINILSKFVWLASRMDAAFPLCRAKRIFRVK